MPKEPIDVNKLADEAVENLEKRAEHMEKLRALWDGCTVAEILQDIHFAIQYVMFRHHHEPQHGNKK